MCSGIDGTRSRVLRLSPWLEIRLMSRIHNLLQKPILQVGEVSPASVAVSAAENGTKKGDVQEIPIERANIDPGNRIVFHTDPSSPSADRFRLLRMRLREFRNTKALKRVLITSPLPHD